MLQNLIDILNKKAIDGVDINLKKLSDKSDVGDFISTVKSKLNSDLLIAVSLPSKPEVLAKFYNLKDLSKHAEFFILQTAFLSSSHNVTFHPSRLSGVWDTHNTVRILLCKFSDRIRDYWHLMRILFFAVLFRNTRFLHIILWFLLLASNNLFSSKNN